MPDHRRRATERPRPRIHFTPPSGWLNDPNGLLVVDGRYHLCYQHNPDAPEWGNLHWGHAVSDDLFDWEHRPVAIRPDSHGQAFSGSAVIDSAGTSGGGADALVAIYTQHLDGLQRQSIAISGDRGVSWTPHPDNPVIESPPQTRDFRDPKVLRYESADGAWWMMLLAVGPDLWIYRSDDLRRWTRTSTITVPSPWPNSITEVPELVRVPIEDTASQAWVLVVSMIPGAESDGRSRVRWAIVDTDGEALSVAHDGPMAALDRGREFYAPMAWDRGPDAPPVLIGWLDERALAAETGAPWCGRMSLPRELTCVAVGDELRLRQRPLLPAWCDDRTEALPCDGTPTTIDATCWSMRIEAVVPPTGDERIEVTLTAAGCTETLSIVGSTAIACGGAGSADEPLRRTLDVVVDAGSIEAFVDDGLDVTSDIGPFGLSPTLVTVETSDGATIEVAAYAEHPERGDIAPADREAS